MPSPRAARRIATIATALAIGGSVALTVAPAASPAAAATSACVGATAPARYDHVIWIWFENKAPVVGSSSAPYFTSLAHGCGLATNYHAVTHPSLPNYLAATGGSTYGVADDNYPSAHPIAGASIFSQVSGSGRQWRAYDESMPTKCALTSSGTYAVKHNPAAYFTSIRTACGWADLPMGSTSSGAFLSALNNNALPAFAFITPNMCNDMHDCSVATGDKWLSAWMPKILASQAYTGGRTAVVVTFDESDTAHNNLVSTIVVARSVRAGTVSGAAYTHYSLLRTTEQLLGITTYLRSAATAGSMRSAFHL